LQELRELGEAASFEQLKACIAAKLEDLDQPKPPPSAVDSNSSDQSTNETPNSAEPLALDGGPIDLNPNEEITPEQPDNPVIRETPDQAEPLALDGELIDLRPNEEITGEPLATQIIEYETWRVNRDNAGFASSASFHSSYDTIIRYETQMIVKKRIIRVETVTDIHSGKTVRADLSALGPERSKITWAGISLLICLGIEAAMPIDRLHKVLFSALSIFSTSSICRYFQHAARKLVPIYLHLAAELAAKAEVISGDDSKTRCLEMEADAAGGFQKTDDDQDPMIVLVKEKLGRVFPSKKNPEEIKQSLFISHVHGRADPSDPCSTIYLFRTHFGQVGNLLSQLLAMRPSEAPKIILQGDLSSSNFPDPLLMQRWVTRFVGCAAHSRRPFFRSRSDDPLLCERMLELFALLSAVEKQIDRDGRTAKRTLHYRSKLAQSVWEEIRNLAQSVVDAEQQCSARDRPHHLWPKKASLYKGAKYIVKHYKKLTAYLTDYRLEMTNNRAERLLRSEKILLVSSKFRKSEVGRVSLDILRSLVMTVKAALVSPYAYLKWVLSQSEDEIKEKPHLFTPLAYRKLLHAASTSQATGT